MRSVVSVVSVCLFTSFGISSVFLGSTAAFAQTPDTLSGNPLGAIAKRLASGVSKSAKPDPETYTFTPTGKPVALEDLVNTLGQDEAQKKAIRTLLTAGFTAFEEAAKKEGKANDAAAAFTFFIATHYSAATGKTVTDAGSEALYRQVQALFAAPDMKTVTDADKQRFWETCVGLSAFTLGIGEAASDAQTKASLKKVAAASFESLLKVPIESVKITDSGIAVIGSGKTATINSTTDLTYTVPAAWTETKQNGGVLLTRTLKTDEGEMAVNVVVMLGAAQSGKPVELCQSFYKKYLVPQIPEKEIRKNVVIRDIVPDVYRRLVGNGMRCYMAGNFWSKRKSSLDYFGTSQEWHIYYVESGTKWVPIMVSMTGEVGRDDRGILRSEGERYDWLEDVLRGLKGTPSGKPLFTLAEVVGNFTSSFGSTGPMMYSTLTGSAVGMNAVSASINLVIQPTGAFTYKFGGATTYAGSGTRFSSDKDTGKITITNDNWGAFLVSNGKVRTSKYRLVSATVLPNGRRMFLTVKEADKPTFSFIWAGQDRWMTPEKD